MSGNNLKTDRILVSIQPKPKTVTAFFTKTAVFCSTVFLGLTAFTSFQTNKTTDDLLTNPFDLQKLKKAKGQSNSGGWTKKPYYFKPDTVGMYYCFTLWQSYNGYYGENKNDKVHLEDGLVIITYKPLGKYKDNYFDPTETLIEVILRYNDYDLPELAFVGLDTVKIKNKLGDNFLRKDNCFIYSKGKKVLTVKIKGRIVEWLKWTRLNLSLTADNIPNGLTTDKN